MDDYIPRPTQLLPLADIMGRWRPLLDKAISEGAACDAGGGEAAPGPAGPLDGQALHVICAGDPVAEQRALEHFRRINKADIERLEDALQRGDLPSIVHFAHRIKGACGFVGATRLAAASARIEAAGRSGQDGDIDGLMKAFRSELEQLDAYLDARQ